MALWLGLEDSRFGDMVSIANGMQNTITSKHVKIQTKLLVDTLKSFFC